MNYLSFRYADSLALVEWKGYHINIYLKVDESVDKDFTHIIERDLVNLVGNDDDARVLATAMLDAYEEEMFNQNNKSHETK